VIVLECGGGWIAHWMDRLGEFEESYGWTTAGMSLTPEEYFRRQCWISFDPGERTAGVLGPLAGADRFIWASDFPHLDILESEPSATAEPPRSRRRNTRRNPR